MRAITGSLNGKAVSHKTKANKLKKLGCSESATFHTKESKCAVHLCFSITSYPYYFNEKPELTDICRDVTHCPLEALDFHCSQNQLKSSLQTQGCLDWYNPSWYTTPIMYFLLTPLYNTTVKQGGSIVPAPGRNDYVSSRHHRRHTPALCPQSLFHFPAATTVGKCIEWSQYTQWLAPIDFCADALILKVMDCIN